MPGAVEMIPFQGCKPGPGETGWIEVLVHGWVSRR